MWRKAILTFPVSTPKKEVGYCSFVGRQQFWNENKVQRAPKCKDALMDRIEMILFSMSKLCMKFTVKFHIMAVEFFIVFGRNYILS